MLFNVVKHHLHVCTEVISLDPDLGNLPLASAGNTGRPYVAYKWFINYPGVKGRVEKGSCDIIYGPPTKVHLSVCNFAFTIESWRPLRSRPSREMRELASCAADQDKTFPRGINAVAADLGPGAALALAGQWAGGDRD